MADDKTTSYRFLTDVDGDLLGNFAGSEAADVNIKLSLHLQELEPTLHVRLSLLAPQHMNVNAENRFYASVLLANASIGTGYHIVPVDAQDIPDNVRESPEYQKVADNEKVRIMKLTIPYTKKGIVARGLHQYLPFSDYREEDTDIIIQKPHVARAYGSMNRLFDTDRDLVFFVREEHKPLKESFKDLYARFKIVEKEGLLTQQFFTTKPRPGGDHPIVQKGIFATPDNRPQITIRPMFGHPSRHSFAVVNAVAATQSAEYAADTATRLSQMVLRARFLQLVVYGDTKYFVALEMDPSEDTIRLQENDTFKLSFALKAQKDMMQERWHGVVISSLPWLRAGEIPAVVSRPRLPALEGEKKLRPYIPGVVPCGQSSVATDVELYTALQSAPVVNVRITPITSSKTTDRQVNALRLLQAARTLEERGPNQRPTSVANPYLEALGEFWCNQQAQPTARFDFLRTAVAHIDQSKSGDLPAVVAYLQQLPRVNDLYAFGLINGRAGVGKTYVAAVIIRAMLLANPDAKILVTTPSNQPTDEAVKRFIAATKDDKDLMDLLIVRAHSRFVEQKFTKAFAEDDHRKAKERVQKTPPETAETTLHAYRVAKKQASDAKELKEMRDRRDAEFEAVIVERKIQKQITKTVQDDQSNSRCVGLTPEVVALVSRMKYKQLCHVIDSGDDFRTLHTSIAEPHNVTCEHLHAYLTTLLGTTRAYAQTLCEQSSVVGPVDAPDDASITEPTDLPYQIDAHELKAGVEVMLDNTTIQESPAINADGSINLEAFDQPDLYLSMKAGYDLVRHIERTTLSRELVQDHRFRLATMSVGYLIFVIAGVGKTKNRYTDPQRWADFRSLFAKYVEDGADMNDDDQGKLKAATDEIVRFVVEKASVMFTTCNNAAEGIYAQHFGPVDLAIGDEYNRAVIPDACIITAHYQPRVELWFGDDRQLTPVVTGPTPLMGMLKALQVSPLRYRNISGWPAMELKEQKRSHVGIQEIPTLVYYKSQVVDGPDARSPTVHQWTQPTIELLDDLFDQDVIPNATSFFEVAGAGAIIDQITKSRFNLDNASLAINILERSVAGGCPPASHAIVTPYSAQVAVYKYAIWKLAMEYPQHNWTDLQVGTTDSMEGSERPVVLVDLVVTSDMGFVNEPERMLVALTRAKDACVVIGSSMGLRTTRRNNEIAKIYDMAKERYFCYAIESGHEFLTHRFVEARVRFTTDNVDALNQTYQPMETNDDPWDQVVENTNAWAITEHTAIDDVSAAEAEVKTEIGPTEDW